MTMAKAAFVMIVVHLFMLVNFGTARASEIRMDLVTCQPDGVRGKLQAGYDPLKYWAEQKVALERYLEIFNIERPDEDCSTRASNKIEFEECRGYIRNYVDSVKKCIGFSRIMLEPHRK